MCVCCTYEGAFFLGQPFWATGCPDIWQTIILGVSAGVFLEEINMWLRLMKRTALPGVGGPHPATEGLTRAKSCPQESSCSQPVFQLGQGLSCCWTRTYTTGSPASPACQVQSLELLSLHHSMSQFLIINLFIYKHTHTHTLSHTLNIFNVFNIHYQIFYVF